MDGEVELFELELETWLFTIWLVKLQKLKKRQTVAAARLSRNPFLAP